jgi:ABC-type Mn2+/Zn2+ transport system ATPase subunit
MDEPFAGIDAPTQEATLQLLDQLEAQRVTVMVSMHDLNLAAQRFEWVLLLNRGLVAYGSAAEVFTPETIRVAFGDQAFFLPGGVAIGHACPPEASCKEVQP